MFHRLGATLVVAASLLGCSPPTTVTGPSGDGRAAVAVRVLPAGFRLQAAVNPWQATDVATVRLQAFRGTTLAATTTVTKVQLGSAVVIKNLRAGTSYEVRATAFTAASVDITDPAGSKTTFTTPAVSTSAGVATIDDAAVALTLPLKLATKIYAGKLTFKLAPSNAVKKNATHVHFILTGGAAPVTHVVTFAAAQGDRTLTNLKPATTYTILAQAFDQGPPLDQLSRDDRSDYTFTTPALEAGVNDNVNTALGLAASVSVPCR